MQKIILILFIGLFLGCAKYQLYDIDFTQKHFSVEIDGVMHILYISKNDGYNFAIFDTFGVPKANKVLKDGVFESTKFLPRDSFYELLFIESLEMIDKDIKHKDFVLKDKRIKMVEL
ncbi:hypothetical protein [Helicobacter sp. MIT 99-5507]|uniref:hypothetical protein n=1 Tax=Helicobacter sp. MIT 99-5507 TaxID=152489 RepID=UPI000E1F1220|nr:hypothetical protein [Helicobacter sp. MIT 99-5507]RDU56713.1 hypothetical protein CQA42_07860 [Helicobacter sp. MIT 99-5507]